MKIFHESGMTFGPFEDEKVFEIESSKMLKSCNGIKPVEFVYHKKQYLMLFVEAKSSGPFNHEGNETKYEEFLQDVTQKFEDSFNLFMAGKLERKSGHEEISRKMKTADYKKMNFKFVLIIRGHEKTWLAPLQMDFEKKMKRFKTIWNSDVIVMNDTIARENQLIS